MLRNGSELQHPREHGGLTIIIKRVRELHRIARVERLIGITQLPFVTFTIDGEVLYLRLERCANLLRLNAKESLHLGMHGERQLRTVSTSPRVANPKLRRVHIIRTIKTQVLVRVR